MFSGSPGSHDLSFGMTCADFYAFTKQFDASKELMRLVMTGRVAGRLPLSTLAHTVSCAGTFFDGTCIQLYT